MSLQTQITDDYLFYALALKAVPKIGAIKAKKILNQISFPKEIFTLSVKDICNNFSLSEIDAISLKQFKGFKEIENEMSFIKKNKIQTVFYNQIQYPNHLKHIDDSPFLLFYLGELPTVSKKIITIIGTRQNSDYGRKITEQIVSDLAYLDVAITSGLALGIDSIAHNAALKNKLQTIAVLGHGLKTIYPATNKDLAKTIINEQGVLMTEFSSTVTPSKETFPIRNRIVAGLCDVLIVVETKKKGGSIITANFANDYNKDVFAVPGNLYDEKSAGCNYLISSHKAFLLNDASDIISMMNWDKKTKPKVIAKDLFVNLTNNQKTILNIIEPASQKVHLDLLIINAGLTFSILSSELLDLEFKGIVKSLPGKFYTMV